MTRVQFRSVNVPNHFLGHRAFLGELMPEDGPQGDFTFTVVRRGHGLVALRSVSFPDRFLRHRDFRIRLEAPAGGGDTAFARDSTFHRDPGLADPENPQAVSFRSVNCANHYLRHRNFSLFLEPEDSPNLALDATFHHESAPVIIDRGTNLEPADG